MKNSILQKSMLMLLQVLLFSVSVKSQQAICPDYGKKIIYIEKSLDTLTYYPRVEAVGQKLGVSYLEIPNAVDFYDRFAIVDKFGKKTTLPLLTLSPWFPTDEWGCGVTVVYKLLRNGNIVVMWYSGCGQMPIIDTYFKIVDITGKEIVGTKKINTEAAQNWAPDYRYTLNRFTECEQLANNNLLFYWATDGGNYAMRRFRQDGTPIDNNQLSITSLAGISGSQYTHKVVSDSASRFMFLIDYNSAYYRGVIFDSSSTTPVAKFNAAQAGPSTNTHYDKTPQIKLLPNGKFLMVYRKQLAEDPYSRAIAYKIINRDGTVFKPEVVIGPLCAWGEVREPIITSEGVIIEYTYNDLGDYCSKVGTKHFFYQYDFNGNFVRDISNCFPAPITPYGQSTPFLDIDGGIGIVKNDNDPNDNDDQNSWIVRRSFGPPMNADSVTEITKTTAKYYATIGDPGDLVIQERGFIYSRKAQNANPQLDSANVVKNVVSGTGFGKMNQSIIGLDSNTIYIFKAYSKTTDGQIFYSDAVTFTTNQSPVIMNPQVADTLTVNVAENATLAITFQIADPDGGQVQTYTISGEDSASFSVNQAAGTLSFKTAPDFEKPSDANKDNTFVLKVKVADNGNYPKYDSLIAVIKVTDVAEKPSVDTMKVNSVGMSAASFTGMVNHDGGGGTITERGFVYALTSTNANPEVGGSGVTKVVVTGTLGTFTAPVSGLQTVSNYSVKSYAINATGTTYSNVARFTTLDSSSGPYIGYDVAPTYELKTLINSIIPIQGGTAVPAMVYKQVSTFAGAVGSTSTGGSTNATGNAARFNGPRGMARDSAGNIYVADRDNHLIRKITAAGVVTTLAGTSGSSGSTDAIGTAAKFNAPEDVVIDPTYKYLYVSDRNNHKIRKIDLATGAVTTFAGTGTSGSVDNYTWSTQAQFNQPSALSIDADGNLYIADYGNNKIRKVTAVNSNVDSTTNNSLHFDGTDYVEIGGTGDLNFTNAMTVEAWFKVDAFDKSWQTIVSKGDNSWRLSRTWLGNNIEFYMNKVGNVAIGVTGNKNVNDGKWHHAAAVFGGNYLKLYVDGELDGVNNITATTMQASTAKAAIGHNTQQTDRKWKGNIDEVRLWSVAKTADQIRANMHKNLQGNEDSLKAYYKLDQGTAGGTNTGLTTVTNNATSGSALNGVMTGFSLTGATSNWVSGFAHGGWSVSTLAGTGTSGATDGDAIITATFKQPQNVIVAKTGEVYVSEVGNHKIRKVQNGVVSTLAGTVQGYGDGVGTVAKLNQPFGMALDGAGNLYVTEVGNHTIRKITPTGVVSTFAGTAGVAGATDTVGLFAGFNKPCALLMDPINNKMYVSDYEWDKIRSINMGGYELNPALPKGLSFDNTTGVISGTPTELTLKNYYNNTFSDTALKGGSTFGATVWAGDYMMLTTLDNGKAGAFMVPASGNNANKYKVGFTLVTAKSTGGADGISYSFADDATIDATSPAAQVGTGTKLSLSFDDYENTGGEKGIRLLYGTKSNSPGRTPGANGLLAYSNNLSWLGKRSSVVLIIDTAGKATVLVNGEKIFNKVQLPESFKTSSKATWKHVFRAVTGGFNDIHGIDNLFIEEGDGAAAYEVSAYNFNGSSSVNVPLNIIPKPLPNISYSSKSLTFLKKKAITPLTLTNTGGSVRTTGGYLGKVVDFAGSGQSGSQDGSGTNSKFNGPKGIVYDKVNKVFYVTDTRNQKIRKLTADGTVTTFAGTGISGFANGAGLSSQFTDPEGIAIDATGNVFVADFNNALIRKITPAGVVSTFAGTQGITGNTNGTGTAAKFNGPIGISVDDKDNVLVSEFYNFDIRKITPAGVVTTYAGSTQGYVNAVGTAAQFGGLFGTSIDLSGNLYVVDNDANVIRKVANDLKVTTFAGSTNGYKDGPAATAQLSALFGTAVDEDDNLYVSEFGKGRIRKVSNTGIVSTLTSNLNAPACIAVGDSSYLYVVESGGNKISKVNLLGYSISPALPAGLTMDSTGTISGTPTKVTPKQSYTIIAQNETGLDTTIVEIEVVPDLPNISYTTPQVYTKNVAISPLSPTNTGGIVPIGKMGAVTTFAGSTVGYADGVGTAAKFYAPTGITIDKNDNLFVTDFGNRRIRKIAPDGTVTTISGTGVAGKADGNASTATYNYPFDLVINDSGVIYLNDQSALNVRKIDLSGNVTTLAGGIAGTLDGTGIAARFYTPFGITASRDGNLFMVDLNSNNVRKITPAGVVTTFAGNYKKQGYQDGQDTSASFKNPAGIAMDSTGNFYVADFQNYRIRKISATGYVSTFAGAGIQGYQDGTAADAKFSSPQFLAIDKPGNVYITEPYNYVIRKISPNGTVSTIAGLFGIGGNQDGFGAEARFGQLGGITVDKKGNIFVVDRSSSKIKKISSTGYRITPELPAGLTLDTMGIISGTPTVTSPKTTYTIIATNEDGDDTTTIDLAVNEVAVAVVPTLTTTAISAITQTAASSGGDITADGGAAILERGVVWSTVPLPVVGSNQTSNGSNVGAFNSDLSGLQPNTLYYVRAYATNSAGTGYGNELNFKTSAVPSAGATALSITAPSGAVTKVYDGTTKATVTTGTLSGVTVGDQVTLNSTAQYEHEGVGTNKKVIVTYSLSGPDAAKYLPPANDTITIGSITAKPLLIQPPVVTKQKVYDGNTDVQVAAGKLIGVEGADLVTVQAIATYDTKTAGTNKSITVTYTLDGANSGNYQKPVDTVIIDGVITKAVLTVKAKTDAKFAGENDVTGYKGVLISGYVNGESIAEVNQSGLSISRTNIATNTSADYPGVLAPSGLSADNYDFDYINGDYSIIPADQLLVRIKDTTVTYGSTPLYVIESAKYFKTGASLIDLTNTTTVNGDTIVAHDGAVSTSFVVTKSGAITSSSNTLKVGAYSLDTANVQLSINVNSLKLLGDYTVTAKPISVDASGGATKQYDATRDMLGVQLKLNGVIAGDNLQVNGKGLFDTKESGTGKSYTISQLIIQGIDAENYYLSGSGSITGSNGVITAKQLTITAPTITKTKLADGNTLAAVIAGNVSGVEKGENITVNAVANYDNASIGNNKTIQVVYNISGPDTANYLKPVNDSITDGQILDTLLTISNPILQYSKEYDGTDSTVVTAGILSGIKTGDIVTVSATASFNNKNVDTNKTIIVVYTLGGADAAKYRAPKSDTFTTGIITAKQLSVTPPIVTLSKVYDGTTAATVTVGTLSGMAAGENIIISAIANYDDKNVGVGKTIYVNYTLDGGTTTNYIRPTNYTTNAGEITQAPLTVLVNDDAKFVGETDATNYRKVSISGYVKGETIAEIDTTGLSISRVNSGVESAGDYDSVLTASGLTAVNYSFSYKNGKYSIIPADHLLVKINTAKTVYGTKPLYTLESAKYYKSAGNVLIDLTGSTTIKGDSVEAKDGATKTTFMLNRPTATFSKANQLNVGSYLLDTTSVMLSNNVVGVKVIGLHEVAAKKLTVLSSAVSKTYDGTMSMANLQLSLDSLIVGDSVTVSGLGFFNNKKVAINKSYQLSNIQLTGPDAINYYLQGGDTLTGNNGSITAKQLIITAPSLQKAKVFDSTTKATVFVGDLLGVVDGDVVTVNAVANYADAAVGSSKKITVTYALSGKDSLNYIKPVDYVDTTGEIKLPKSLTTSVDSLIGFEACANDTAHAQSFVVTAVGLSDNVNISVPAGFEIAIDTTSGYNNNLSIQPTTKGDLNTTVFVRMQALSSSPANSYIIVASSGLKDKKIALSGTVNVLPTVATSNGVAVLCIGKTASFTNSTTGGVWSSLDTAVATINANGSVSAVKTGNTSVIYTVTDAHGCKASATSAITISELPTVASIVGSSSVCKSSITTLTNSTTGGVWSSSNTSVATIDANGIVKGISAGNVTISYTVTNANGCSTTVTKTITVNELPIVADIAGLSEVCVNANTVYTNASAGGVWSSSNNNIATVNTSGAVTGVSVGTALISYAVTNSNGCLTTVTKSVTVNALPIVSASINNNKVSKGGNAVLTATGVGTFAWTPATNIVNPDKSTTPVKVVENTTFTVTLTNAFGCANTATISVEAVEDFNVTPSNAFTPNGDGINDRFVIKNIDMYPDNMVVVYDRSGKTVYQAMNYANTWNGQINGVTLAKDSYFYILTVRGRVVSRGTVTLVR